MPSLRLTDREAADVVAYLESLTAPEWESRDIPALDEEALRAEVKWRFMDTMSEAEAEARLGGMSVKDQQMYLAGKLIGRYGCFSCHNLNGPPGCGPVSEGGNGSPCFSEYGPIGVELTQEANKSIEKLDFGHVHIPHTKPDWFYTKLRTPRVWDTGKVVAVKDRLRMPSFGFSPEEAERLTSFILGLKKNIVGPSKMADQDALAEARNRGHRTIESLNCRGCHLYQGTGGAVRPVVQDWLMNREGMDEATAAGYYPPEITGEGAKVQADWLVGFLQEPWEIRPWMKVVMPTFHFEEDSTNQVVNHFIAASEVDTFEVFDCEDVTQESIRAGRMLASDKYFKCVSCHIVGDKFPAGTPDRWAPNFAMVPERLRHEWIIDWLRNPSAIQPGTKMPQFFYGEKSPYTTILEGSNAAQMKALADYLRCGQDAGALRALIFSSPSEAGTPEAQTSSVGGGATAPTAAQEAKL